jgi:hypothetical protein
MQAIQKGFVAFKEIKARSATKQNPYEVMTAPTTTTAALERKASVTSPTPIVSGVSISPLIIQFVSMQSPVNSR